MAEIKGIPFIQAVSCDSYYSGTSNSFLDYYHFSRSAFIRWIVQELTVLMVESLKLKSYLFMKLK